ncbi:Hypothetical predicted protein [Paramuricea clavata]|uniref:Uncharacterized protein n=1 Tax=Paramuricea clavata TaxID=317549 RepID=A0A7D9IGL4_PARCT|nr:Hypothetical predicted protein [Paramuricea clavata]
MENYKSLIDMQVEKETPVVTFQDNMQLMRTSMRHLRLSKLHKDKVKQNKIWDFTVCGWRVVDISGIEDLFQYKSSVEPQRAFKDLKYEDLIKNNPPHEYKWKEFRERNRLWKMDVAFNTVNVTKEQLRNMRSEDLQRAASNLDLFKKEFDFVSDKQPKFIPLQSSGKDFDLDRAYKWFAFLKSLEYHKKTQHDYEQILHGKGTVEEITENGDEEIIAVVNQDDEEDSMSD